jgi:multimeric flavodoxin WrbA
MRGIIIQGSARAEGDTYVVCQYLKEQASFDFIDLLDYQIAPYDYKHQYVDDDYLPLMRHIVENYDLIIFATPVYWYSMSGVMKDFFDRITDVLKIEKDTGRKLRGKKMAMLCCSSNDEEYPEFHMPFKRSAEYLGMQYLGDVHTWVEDGQLTTEVKARINHFIGQLN